LTGARARPDGRPEPVTRFSTFEFSSNPAWSADGQQIAFSYYRLPGESAIPVPDGTDLYRMKADGTGLTLVATHEAPGVALQYPAWVPDGTAVYVAAYRPGASGPAVERVDLRSGARRPVVSDAGFPAPSRDGRRLAYVRFPTPPAREQSVWWSAPDGSQAREVVGPTAFDKYFGVRFAPDGGRLLFAAGGAGPGTVSPSARRREPLGLLGRLLGPRAAFANGDLWDLWTVDLDGRNLRRLTTLGEDLPVAAWSPDGRHVAFLGGGSASTAEAGLTILQADGQLVRRLTTQPGHRGLDWAPPPRGARRR